MKNKVLCMLGLSAALSMSSMGQTEIIIDDFEAGAVSTVSGRFRAVDFDLNWFANLPSIPSEWLIMDGTLQNSATNTGAYPAYLPAEGAAVRGVTQAADTNNTIDISVDYDVSTNDTLFIHLWAFTYSGTDFSTAGNVANFQSGGGGLGDNTTGNADLISYKLLSGIQVTGSGTYTNAINIEGLAIDDVEMAGDFDYYQIAFAKDEDGLPGTTSVDNLSITTSYEAPTVIPPPPSGVVWENDMSTDPVGDGWVVRNGKANYTMGDGVMILGEGAFSTLVDTDPYNGFDGITKVEFRWRTTSHSDPGADYGAGIWLNCDGDAPDYYPTILSSLLNTNDNTQTVKMWDPGNGLPIDTIPGFGTGMIDAMLTIDAYNETVDYILTDGTLSVTGSVSLVAATTGGTGVDHTLFTKGPTCEIDYVRLEANVSPDEAYFAADPAALNMSLFEADSTVEDSLDIIYNSATNLDVTVTISDEDYAGSFSVLSETNQIVNPSGSTTLEFQFDRTVANLVGGQTATGLVTIAWAEVGGGESGSVVVPISGSVGYSPSPNAWTGGGNGMNWGDADNWALSRVPGAVAADFANILDASTVTVATNASTAFSPLESLTVGAGSTLNVDADLPATKTLYIDGVIDINGGTFTIDNTANNVTSGAGLIKLRSGTLQTTAAIAQRTENYECAIEISGGTVNMKHQAYYTGGLTIIGDAATVNMGYFNSTSIINFELGENGVSTIDGSGTWSSLASATININGTNYTGGSQTIDLIRSSNLSNTSTAVNVTGFAAEYITEVAQDMDTDLVTLTITAPGYLGWSSDYGVGGSANNEDGDVLNNLYEYGLGGNPTNSADIGMDAALVSGSDYIDYVHVRRVEATNEISYALALTDNLQHGPWTTNAGYTIVGYGPLEGDFDTVTNRIDTTSKSVQFIKLIIEEL